MRYRFIAITVLILVCLPFTVRAGDANDAVYPEDIRYGQFELAEFRLIAPSGRVWELVEDSVPDLRCRPDSISIYYIDGPCDTIGYTPILKWRIVEEDSHPIPTNGIYHWPDDSGGIYIMSDTITVCDSLEIGE